MPRTFSDEFRANPVEWNETPEKPNKQIFIKRNILILIFIGFNFVSINRSVLSINQTPFRFQLTSFSEVYKFVEDNIRGETILIDVVKQSDLKQLNHSLQIPSLPTIVSFLFNYILNMYFFISTKPVLIISFNRFEINILQLPWKIWTEKQSRHQTLF